MRPLRLWLAAGRAPLSAAVPRRNPPAPRARDPSPTCWWSPSLSTSYEGPSRSSPSGAGRALDSGAPGGLPAPSPRPPSGRPLEALLLELRRRLWWCQLETKTSCNIPTTHFLTFFILEMIIITFFMAKVDDLFLFRLSLLRSISLFAEHTEPEPCIHVQYFLIAYNKKPTWTIGSSKIAEIFGTKLIIWIKKEINERFTIQISNHFP